MKDKKGSRGIAWFSIEERKLSIEYSYEGLRLTQKPSSLAKQDKTKWYLCHRSVCH